MKKVVIGAGILVVLAVLFLAIFMGDQPLDLESDQVTNLYSYLGEVDVYRCGGLNQYLGEEVTYDSLSNNNKMCMAFYKLDASVIEKQEAEVTSLNDSGLSICEVGEDIRFVTDEEGDEACNYQVIPKDELASSYQMVYGEELPDDESFYISGTQACYLGGDQYYCGDAETFVYSLSSEATIYRLMDRAVKRLNGDLVITDYYLRISGNKCYSSNGGENEITACSTLLEENADLEVDTEFIQEYGTLYEHVFKQDDQGNYYWYSSNVK